MSRKEQLKKLKTAREALKKELEDFYISAFERIASLNIGEKNIAKLTQLLLQSRNEAIKPLERTIEDQLITKAND